MSRKNLKETAQQVFQRNYWPTVGTLVLITLLSGLVSIAGAIPFIGCLAGIAASVFVTLPLQVSQTRFILNNRIGKGSTGDISYCFGSHYMNIVKTMFMQNLFIFLWSLLLVVHGIIKSYEWMMVPYIVAENPDIDYHAAMDRSRRMMDGHKMEAFVLGLSFIGWYILSGITFGLLGIFYVNPYVAQTMGEYYVSLSNTIVEPNINMTPVM